MVELANLYFYGLIDTGNGCERDYGKAYELLEKLKYMDAEHAAMADSMIAEMCYHGVMPRYSQSYEMALAYHESAKWLSGFSAREGAYLKSRGCGCGFQSGLHY